MKFLRSRAFVVICTLCALAFGVTAGTLLAYQPYVTGSTFGSSGMYGGTTKGSTGTEYIFLLKAAIGYWMFALILTLIVLTVCILIRYVIINRQQNIDAKLPDESNNK